MEDHSSTKVRQELAKGNSIVEMCGEEVEKYWREQKLAEWCLSNV
jgi:nicotinic acid mononucleotide adenylyltransferase